MKKEDFLTYKELPACIRGHLVSFVLLGIGLMIFGLSAAIGMQSLDMLLILLMILIAFAIFCISWSLPFFSNKIRIIEGRIKEIESNEKTEKGLSGIFARELVRYTFTLDVEGQEVSVIKTGTKIKKKDVNVVLYVPEDAIIQKSDGSIFISRILYVENVK